MDDRLERKRILVLTRSMNEVRRLVETSENIPSYDDVYVCGVFQLTTRSPLRCRRIGPARIDSDISNPARRR
jgi:hypothetical protein